MREVGVIASYSKSFEASMLIYKDAELYVREEVLVVVDDIKFGKRYLGVLRFVTKLDPLLTTSQRSAVIEKPEIAQEGVDIPYEVSTIRIIGEIVDGMVEPPTAPPTPRSKVFVVESPNDLKLDLGRGLVVGVHKYSGIEIPMNPEALRYHIAVVGTTGTGKSRLVKALVDEVLIKTKWSVIIFDHTGIDYAPYWPNNTIKADNIVLDVDTITEGLAQAIGSIENLLKDYMPLALLRFIVCKSDAQLCSQISQLYNSDEQDYRRSSGGIRGSQAVGTSKAEVNISRNLIEELAIKISANNHWNSSELAKIVSETSQMLGARRPTPQKLALYISLFAENYVNRLNNMSLRVDNLVEKVYKERILVVDLSNIETEARRVIVKRVLEKLWEIIIEKLKPIDTLVIVDEAHNYACEHGCKPSNILIEKSLREGRKWGLGVVLASQRVIDLATDVRNNVSTVFFSRLQTPYDFKQLEGFIDLAGIRPETLSLLGTREFFFAGLGNPLKYPMLIRVREVGGPRGSSS
jgi:DNA helicase HerA-like ATPase